MSRLRFVTTVIAALYFGALIGLTFVQISAQARDSWLFPVAVFLPVGFLLVLLMGPRRWWAAIAFSVLGAAWIEAAQSIWMPEGYANYSDILLAALGATIGVIAGVLLGLPAARAIGSHDSPSIVTQAGSREIP